MVRSIIEDGYSWVEIDPSELWDKAIFNTYFNGMDIS